jgi:hypothetical protein
VTAWQSCGGKVMNESEPQLSIPELMEQIRRFVNTSWKHYALRQERPQFHQLVSALDTIEDAEEAILAFGLDEIIETTGVLYLVIYGLLQAFFLQQDASTHLCEALGIDNTFSKYPRLKEIREIRNDSIGHPTKRDGRKGQPTSYHQISRITMSKEGFQLLSFYSDDRQEFRDISIPKLIADQRKFISEMLILVIQTLQAEVDDHKKKFRMEKLVQLFPHTLGYAFEKTGQGLSYGPVQIGRYGIDTIKDTIQKFNEAVKRRDMEAYTNLLDELKYIQHAITKIEQLLNDRESGTDAPENEYDGYIYLSFLEDKIFKLREYAKEIDEDYA